MGLPFQVRGTSPTHIRDTTPAYLRGSGTPTPPPPPAGFLIDVENPVTSAFPTLLVQVAFFSDPLDNIPQWTDLTDVCRNVTITRGRSFELDQVNAGTATFTFNNLDRNLDPTYADGPYYGLLTSRRLIRLTAISDGVTYIRFTGFVDSWPQLANASDGKQFAETTVTATDLFGWLSTNTLEPITPAIVDDPVWGLVDSAIVGGQLDFPSVESCGSRVDEILDLWPLPPTMRQVDDGNTLLAADTNVSDGETSLNYLQRITDSETGRLFVTKDGALAFQARNHWQSADTQFTPQMVLSDQIEPSYSSIVIDPADSRYIRNVIVRGRSDMSTPIQAQDNTSVRVNGGLPDSRTDLLTASATDFQAQVAWLLAKYAAPGPRFSSVTINPQRFPDLLWGPVLRCDLGDRITLAHTLLNIGDALVGDYWIEAINETWAPQSMQIQYSLSPVDTTTY